MLWCLEGCAVRRTPCPWCTGVLLPTPAPLLALTGLSAQEISTFPKKWLRLFRLISGFPKGGKAAGVPAGGEGRIWSTVGTRGVDSPRALARGSPGGRPWSHGQRAGSCPPRPELSCLKIFERLDPVFRLAQGGLFMIATALSGRISVSPGL